MFKKLFKILFKTLLWLVAIILVVSVVAYLTAGMWIKPVISTVVPKITQTSASLQSADISLFSGRLALKGLKVGNPAGFNDPYVFELGEISVKFQPKTVFSDKIVVDQVLIKGTKIVSEYNQKGQMNLMVLNDAVQSRTNQGTTQPQKAKKESKKAEGSNKTVVIKDLQILDTSLRFAVMGHGTTLNLPDIQEKNIGEKKKMTTLETVQMIVNKLTVEPIKEMAKTTQNALKDAFKTIEQHTKSNESVQKLKDALSGFNPF